jgi:hypothetical protein
MQRKAFRRTSIRKAMASDPDDTGDEDDEDEEDAMRIRRRWRRARRRGGEARAMKARKD